jgi:outer membrane receptor protein involved in Fe transport
MISLVPSMDVDSLGNPFVRITPTNLSASTAHGIELDLTTQISARGSLNLNYTFEEVTDDESNESLNYVPKHQGNLNFEYDFSDKFTSAILFHVQSESLGNFTNSLSGFGTIDARFAFEVEKGTTISLSGYNLTDKYYFETENYPMPGRTILTEVSIRF